MNLFYFNNSINSAGINLTSLLNRQIFNLVHFPLNQKFCLSGVLTASTQSIPVLGFIRLNHLDGSTPDHVDVTPVQELNRELPTLRSSTNDLLTELHYY